MSLCPVFHMSLPCPSALLWQYSFRFLLRYDIKKYRTIPMAIQYFRGGYGRVELAPRMACSIIAIIPIIILYMTCLLYTSRCV